MTDYTHPTIPAFALISAEKILLSFLEEERDHMLGLIRMRELPAARCALHYNALRASDNFILHGADQNDGYYWLENRAWRWYEDLEDEA